MSRVGRVCVPQAGFRGCNVASPKRATTRRTLRCRPTPQTVPAVERSVRPASPPDDAGGGGWGVTLFRAYVCRRCTEARLFSISGGEGGGVILVISKPAPCHSHRQFVDIDISHSTHAGTERQKCLFYGINSTKNAFFFQWLVHRNTCLYPG